jgi:hypothetical protein
MKALSLVPSRKVSDAGPRGWKDMEGMGEGQDKLEGSWHANGGVMLEIFLKVYYLVSAKHTRHRLTTCNWRLGLLGGGRENLRQCTGGTMDSSNLVGVWSGIL